MRVFRTGAKFRSLWLAALFVSLCLTASGNNDQERNSGLLDLLPQIEGWSLTGEPRSFYPENLFEYIDGAAESYLAYDFRELVMAEFQEKGQGEKASLTLDIYDMGNDRNAFGIYSTESYPESLRIVVGNEGYIDGEALNFVAGKIYVKLLCFNGGERTAGILETFARSVDARITERGSLPHLLAVFPADGRIAHSEKYIRRNVLGFEFLSNGYFVSYGSKGQGFDEFLIETSGKRKAQDSLKRLLNFLSAGKPETAEVPPYGYRLRTKDMQTAYLGVRGRYIGGAIRVPDNAEQAAETSFLNLLKSLEEYIGRSGADIPFQPEL